VDIHKIANNKVYWGNKQQIDRYKLFFWLDLGTWPRKLTGRWAQAVLVFELAAWLTTEAKREAQAVLVFELVTWLIVDIKSTGTSCSWIGTSHLTDNKNELTGTSCSWMRTSHLAVDRMNWQAQAVLGCELVTWPLAEINCIAKTNWNWLTWLQGFEIDKTVEVWNWHDSGSLKLTWL